MVVKLKTFEMYHLQDAWSVTDNSVFVVLQVIISFIMYKILWWHPQTTVMYLVHLFSFKPTCVHFLTYLGMLPPLQLAQWGKQEMTQGRNGSSQWEEHGHPKTRSSFPGDRMGFWGSGQHCPVHGDGLEDGWETRPQGQGFTSTCWVAWAVGWGADPVGWSCPINWRRMRPPASQGGSEDLKWEIQLQRD